MSRSIIDELKEKLPEYLSDDITIHTEDEEFEGIDAFIAFVQKRVKECVLSLVSFEDYCDDCGTILCEDCGACVECSVHSAGCQVAKDAAVCEQYHREKEDN
jgi:hypothetical protein